MHAPTGQQFSLSHAGPAGSATAVITQVGASLRSYQVDGIDLTEPYAEHEPTEYANGIVLVPWPNRVADGQWSLDGEQQQLAVTEPAFHNAIHGLLRFAPYSVVDQTAAAVTLAATVYPQSGYPFLLETTVRYELTDDGLVATHAIRNLSQRSAPVALGTHPYLRIGDVPTAELTLQVAADTRFEVNEQLIPVAEVPVEGTPFDLREGASLEELVLNDAFGELAMTDGVATHSLTAPDGRRVELWQDASFGYVQVFTCRTFPSAGAVRYAVAIEPMTAPPNALASGQGLRWLEPEEVWELRWGIRGLLSG